MSSRQREPSKESNHASDELLAMYASRGLPGDVYARVKEHLRTCSKCRSRMDEWNSEQALAVDSIKTTSDDQKRQSVDKSQVAVVAKKKPDALPAFQNTNYKILREIGRGGMGILYLVEHALTARQEVIKVIHPDLIGRLDVRERFLREIQNAAKLNHPNVVQTLSAFEEGDTIGLVMEHVPGVTLSELVKKSGPLPPLPPLQALEVCLQAASALQHADECGMVHRDIKPSNMIIDSSGTRLNLKLLDFGLAKSTSELATATDMTIAGSVLGTPDYMSPEQAMNPSQADIRADIYSLGCTFFFMLVGRPPFQGPTALSILNEHQKGFTPSLEVRHPNLPPVILSLLKRMITPRIEDRFQSPTEVIAALQHSQDVLLGLTADSDSPKIKKNVPMPQPSLANQQSAKDSIKHFFLEKNANEQSFDFSAPLKSTKPKLKRKGWHSNAPAIVGSILPILAIAVAIYLKPMNEWIVLLNRTILGSQIIESSIILVDLPSDITVYIDGHPAKFQRPKAGAPPEIAASPGAYKLSFRRNSLEIFSKTVTLSEGMVQYSLDCADLRLKQIGSGSTDGSQKSRPERTLTTEPSSVSEWANESIIERKYVEAVNQLGTSQDSISEELSSWLQRVESTSMKFETIQSLLIAEKLIRRYRTAIQNASVNAKPADQLKLFRETEEFDRDIATETRTTALPQSALVVESDSESIKLTYRGKDLRVKLNALPYAINRALLDSVIDESDPEKHLLKHAGSVISKGANAGDVERSLAQLAEQSNSIFGKDLTPVFRDIRKSILKSEVQSGIAGRSNVDISEMFSLYSVNRELLSEDATIKQMHFLADGRLTTMHSSAIAKIRNWNTQTGEYELVKTRPVRIVHYEVAPNGKLVAAFSEIEGKGFELTVIIEKTKALLVQSKPDLAEAIGVYFSADNKVLATVDGLGRFERWNLQSNKKAFQTSSKFPLAKSALSAMCLSPALDLVAQASKQNRIQVWQSKDGVKLAESEMIEQILGDNSAVAHMQFDETGDGLLVFRKDGKIENLDITTLKLKQAIKSEFGEIRSAYRSGNGAYLVFLGSENRVGVFDTRQLTLYDQWVHRSPHSAVCATISNSADQVAIGYDNGSISTWKKVPD